MDSVTKENGTAPETKIKTIKTENSAEDVAVKVKLEKVEIAEKLEKIEKVENGAKSLNTSDDKKPEIKKLEEVTKRSIRVQTWKLIAAQRGAVYSTVIFNRIPLFIGNDKAAALLAETDEFKNAKNIKVNTDFSQDSVKLKIISSGKKLFVSAAKDSNALCTRINCEADADAAAQKKAIRSKFLSEHGTDIDVNTDEKFDIIVIGSVAVSKDGHRIGKGNGYVDLEFGILKHCGVITKDTIIVTTVHESQVYDTLPIELFQPYDVPVDIIVTPEEVIYVTKKLPRPTGIHWNLLSERRLGVVPVLKIIKENEIAKGKMITLKSEDTDVESYSKRQPRMNRRRLGRPFKPRNANRDDNNTGGGGGGDDQDNAVQRPRKRQYKGQRPQRVGDGTSDDENPQNQSEQSYNNDRDRRNNRKGVRINKRDFCIRVSNITRNIRIKHLKTELRNRGCYPMFISWKGTYGKCYLHFGKRGAGDNEESVTQIMELLNNLTITVQRGEATRDVQLKVDLVKRTPEGRIETVDVSSV